MDATESVPNGESVTAETSFTEEEDGAIRIGDIYIPPPPLPALTFDSKGPRLIITHIENVNFKSYASKQDLGPFHKNFTAIVGPNGSGKSNVIDAMLFVFGYRAQKIRSKKVGVLIHHSDRFQDLTSCTVKVHFQMIIDKGPHEFEVVPNSQFCIGRTAFKDNSSVYEIDGKRVQFKEVGRRLRSYGIDLDHHRFLILQGEIESISMMKPKGNENDCGMLEFLEDIVGCNRFIEPIHKLSSQVDELTEIRTEKFNRLKGVEKEKQDVQAARNEAVEYLKLENKVTMLENTNLQLKLLASEEDLQKAEEVREEVKQKTIVHSAKEEELLCCQMEKEKEEKEIETGRDECAVNAEKYEEKFHKLEKEDMTCRQNLNSSKEKVRRLEKDLKAEEDKVKDLRKQPGIYTGESSELQRRKEILEKRKEEEESKLQEAMRNMEKETAGLNEQKEKHEEELIRLKGIVNEAKSQMDLVKSELEMLLSTEKKEAEKLVALEEKLKQTSGTIEEKKRLRVEAEERIPDIDSKLKTMKNKLLQVNDKEEKISEQICEKRMKVEEARSSLRAHESRGTVTSFLMKQKSEGKVQGIYGRLGDLGAIDEKYDVAISTACGALDHIVTDTIETAQECVNLLKRHNVGYATCIALDKMQRYVPVMKQPFSAPENVPRLFDLVKVNNPAVLPAFYFALRDTLVTQNLEQATRIGLGRTRYRCVTLRGDVIETSGTMSGGGGRVIRGRMGQSVTACDIAPKEVERMSEELDQLMQEASRLRSEQSALQNSIVEMQKELASYHQVLKKSDMELQSLKERNYSLAKQVEQQKKRVLQAAPDKNKVKELEKRIQPASEYHTKVASEAQVVEEKVQSLHCEILAITKGKIASVRKAVDKITKEIDVVSKNITKSNVSASTATRNMNKCDSKIEFLKVEIEESKKLVEVCREKCKDIEGKAAGIVELRDRYMKELLDWNAKVKAMKDEIDKIKKDIMELKKQGVDIRNELKAKDALVKEKTAHVNHVKTKLRRLQLQSIDEEEEGEEQANTLPMYTVEQLREMQSVNIVMEIGVLKEQLSKMNPNMAAIQEYKRKAELYQKKLQELEEITKKRDSMGKCHDDLRKQRLDEFMKGFKIITSKLKEVYQMITLGGDAELELVDSLDPFSEGIVFSVRPPKKSWKSISNLSGGEKTLSSLALVFALHFYKPTPFYVMDEIDAALDFRNVSIVANYIKERTKNAQFIIISLRSNMFELADRLVGIYKTNNCTKSCTISPHEMVKEAISNANGAVGEKSLPHANKDGSGDAEEPQQQEDEEDEE